MKGEATDPPLDKRAVLAKLQAWHRTGNKLSTSSLRDGAPSLSNACKRHFGSCRNAIEAAGLPYQGHHPRRSWNARSTIQRLKQLDAKGADLSWTGLAQLDYSLAQAAIRYFGQYAKALVAAGLDPKKYRRRQTVRWTNALVIKSLKRIKVAGGDLSMTGMSKENRPLAAAAIKRFCSYVNALAAAGIDHLKVRRIRLWDKPQIIGILRKEHKAGRSVAVSAVDMRLPGFRHAAEKHFDSYADAVRSAGIDYEKVRKISKWTKPKLIEGLQALARQRQDLRFSIMAKEHGRLTHSCVFHFGTYAAAMRAAGIPYDNGFHLLSRQQALSIIVAEDEAGRDIRYSQIRRLPGLESAVKKHFGSYRRAVGAAGLDYPPLKPLAYWTRPRVLKTLLILRAKGVDMRYAAFKVSHQSLFAAARYYYGRYHLAVTASCNPRCLSR